MQYWPIFAFAFALFIGSIGTAIGATMWLAGKLTEQDARRIELKEAILLEVRTTRHTLYGRLDQQAAITDEKIDDLRKELKDHGTRLTRLEALLNQRNHNR